MNFIKPKRAVSRVFLHCSASDNPNHDNVETITQWHLARKFNEIGYHFYINKKGMVFNGRPLEKVPAAQEKFNTNSIAICLGGNLNFTTEQFRSLTDLCHAINEAYKGAVTFHGHKEVDTHGKTCPNYSYKTILGLVDKGTALDERGFLPLRSKKSE